MKEFIRFHILTLIVLLFAGSWTNSVWGNTWTVKVGIGTSSVGAGSAVAQIYSDAVAGGGVQATTDVATTTTLKEKSWSSTLNTTKAHCIYTATPNNGYAFEGWYTSAACNSNSGKQTNNPYEGPSEGGKYKIVYWAATDITYTYYAKFIPVTVNSVASNSNPSTNKLTFDQPGNKTATVKFNVSNADATDDFTKDLTGAVNTDNGNGGWKVDSWSYKDNKVTVILKFYCTKYTAQGDHSATIKLTSKATNGTYQSATVVANVDLTPTLKVSTESVVFDTYNLVTSSKMSKAVTLTFASLNAEEFEYTPNSTLAPFSYAVTDGVTGQKTLTVYFEPTEQNSWTKEIVVTISNAQTPKRSVSKTITISGSAVRHTATVNGDAIVANYMVDAPSINLATAWTSTSDGAITYSKVSFAPSSANNSGLVSAPTITGNQLSLGQAGELVIRLYQPQTTKYNAVDVTKTITIHKYNSTFANVADLTAKVDENVTSQYSLTYTKPDNSYVGDNIAAGNPTLGASSGNYYYTLAQNVTTNVTAGSPDASLAITYNAGTKTATGKNAGVGTIHLYQKETYKYKAADTEFKVTVSKYTTAFSGVAYDLMVDGTQTANYTYTNTSATKPTANSADNFYYTIDNVVFTNAAKNNGNNLITFNKDNKLITACNAGSAKITLHQKETYKYTGSTASYDVRVHKFNSTYAGVEDLNVKVDENITSAYTLTYTKPNSSYVGAANHAASTPTLGENSSNCFYTIAHNVTTEFTTGSPDATKAFAYNAGTKTATGKNQGVGTVALTQLETYKYNAATDTFRVMVSKHANALSCSWGDWTKEMSNNANVGVTFTATNTNYSQSPIQVTQTYGEEVAVLANNKVTTNSTDGYATWYLYQEANYKYNAAEADVMVLVDVPAPPTCYVLEDYTTHEFSTHINDWEGHFDTPIAINAPVDKIWFTACRQVLGADYFTVEYTVDNGAHWRTIVDNPGLSTSDRNYGPYSFPGLQSNEKVTHIRFGAKQGATLSKWYKNIKVSRKAYLNIQDASHNNISTLTMPNNTIGNSTTAKIYVDYSTCANTIYLESNNPHFKLSKSQFTADGDNRDTDKEEIVITYTNSEVSKDTAIISVYTSYQRKVIRVTAETNRRVQTLTWQEYQDLNFTTNPITVPVGIVVNNNNPAALASSNNLVKYASENEDIIKIINSGYGFEVVGAGTTTLTVSEAGNGTWLPVSETKTITATDKIIQEISWQQTFPLRMQINDVIDLEAEVYLRNTTTGAKTISPERTAELRYSSNNTNVVTIDGAKMTIAGYGTATITARVDGNEEYEAAAPVKLSVVVRAPSTGCETPLTFYHGESIEIFLWDYSFTDWNTPQITTDALGFDLNNGKPDKLSFQHEGEPYTVLRSEFYGGTIKVQEHVNNSWRDVTNSSVVPTKKEWNTKDNVQLSEDADSIRFVRLAGGTGYHYIKDIQVTLRQYLRTVETTINFDSVKVGEVRKDSIGIVYSNLKGDIAASRLVTEDAWLSLANDGVIDIACGTHGHYDLPIEFAPKSAGEWKDTIRIFDNIANLEVRVALEAIVIPSDEVVYTTPGTWGTDTNWNTGSVPGPTADVTVGADVTITGDITINSLSIADTATVTVTSGNTLTIGSGTPKELTGYGNLHVEDGAQVIVSDEGKLNVNDFILDAILGDADNNASSGQIFGEDSLAVNGNVYFQMSFDPSGAISFGWYDFTVPFEVNMADGISRVNSIDDRVMVNGVDFMVMEFDEVDRANGGRGWQVLPTSAILLPGRLYTVTFNYQASLPQNAFRFEWNGNGEIKNGESLATQYTNGTHASLRGFNGVGNGTLRHGYLAEDYRVQCYNHNNKAYDLITESRTFAVGSAFFIQVEEGVNSVAFENAEATVERPLFAPQREVRVTEEFLLSLRNENAKQVDALYFSGSEDATDEYVIGRDLLKMGTLTDAKVAQMWATKGDIKLCDIETTLSNDNAQTDLVFFAPQEGTYELNIKEAPENTDLYLTYNGRIIWDLMASPYIFDLAKGTTEGYGLLMDARAPHSTTGVDNIDAESQTMRKVLIDNVIYIITPEGAMYDVTGKFAK